MYIRKRTFVRIITYLTAAAAALGALSIFSCAGSYRRASEYAYSHAFDEVVTASEKLSDALHRGAYATGAQASSAVCADVYASCLAAGMTMTALPFSTQELSRTAAFVGTAGDYAKSLLREAAADGFGDAERENFRRLYTVSAKITKSLKELHDDVDNGSAFLDEPENRFQTSGTDSLLSTALMKLEGDMDEVPTLEYSGDYTAPAAAVNPDPISEKEAKNAAAEFLGTKALKTLWRSESGSTCFGNGDRSIIVDSFGNVISVSSDRVVSGSMSSDKMKKTAEKFLEDKGFSGLELTQSERVGDVLSMSFACVADGVLREGDCVRIAIAADDGKLYSFDASKHIAAAECPDTTASVSEAQARKALPDSVTALSAALVFAEAPGGDERLCYDFACRDGDEKLHILVDAHSGKQFAVRF